MNAYRDAAPKAARRRFEFRGRGSLAPLVACVLIGALASIFLLQRVYVTCSRKANACTYGVVGVFSEQHAIKLSTISTLDVEKNAHGFTRLEFATDTLNAPVTRSFDELNEAEKHDLAERVTRYVQSSEESFDGGYGPSWKFAITFVLAILLAALNVWRGGPSARVVYEANGDIAIVTIRDRPFRRAHTFEIATPRMRVWKGMIELHDEHGVTIPLPANETDPQARGLATVLTRDV